MGGGFVLFLILTNNNHILADYYAGFQSYLSLYSIYQKESLLSLVFFIKINTHKDNLSMRILISFMFIFLFCI